VNWQREYAEMHDGDGDEDVGLEVGSWAITGRVEIEIGEAELSLSAYITSAAARRVAAALLRSADRLDGGAAVEVGR